MNNTPANKNEKEHRASEESMREYAAMISPRASRHFEGDIEAARAFEVLDSGCEE